MHSRFLAALLVSAACASAACGISTPSDNDIDLVAGIIPIGSSEFKTFVAKKNGEVAITVTTLVPTPSASLGMAVGQPVGTGCTPIAGYLSPLVANRTAEFGYFNKGTYCVIFYDTGAMIADTAYTAKISHP